MGRKKSAELDIELKKILSDTLKNVLKSNEMTRPEFAQNTGIALSMIDRYLSTNNTIAPSESSLAKMRPFMADFTYDVLCKICGYQFTKSKYSIAHELPIDSGFRSVLYHTIFEQLPLDLISDMKMNAGLSRLRTDDSTSEFYATYVPINSSIKRWNFAHIDVNSATEFNEAYLNFVNRIMHDKYADSSKYTLCVSGFNPETIIKDINFDIFSVYITFLIAEYDNENGKILRFHEIDNLKGSIGKKYKKLKLEPLHYESQS